VDSSSAVCVCLCDESGQSSDVCVRVRVCVCVCDVSGQFTK
jgi:hypothetical protein